MKRFDLEFYKKLFALVVPIAFQNFMFAAVSALDAIMLGFLNQGFLSAVFHAGQIQFMHSLFLAALVIGTTVLVLNGIFALFQLLWYTSYLIWMN